MYSPSHFRNEDLQTLIEFIKEFSFGTLITIDEIYPSASMIPMELLEIGNELYLFGHVSAANPQAKIFADGNVAALAIFSAGHSYVSSSWYSHPNVSTWNYRAVHVSGNLFELSFDEFKAHLYRMQNTYEKGQEKPALAENLPDGLFEKFIKAIRGFKIEVVKMEGAWKLSQNRNEKDHQAIIDELQKSEDAGAQEIANEMKKGN